MKKKLIALGLVAALVCTAFSGCGDAEEKAAEESTTEKNPEEVTSEEEKAEEEKITEGETAEEGAASEEAAQELEKVTLNEVAHSIFYAPQYVAIENGYFEEEGIELELVCGYGADKVMAAVLSGDAQIGFMGAEASIYAYAEGANDPVINFAQGTQRAGNFVVAREEMPDFEWEDLKGKDILGGRKGG